MTKISSVEVQKHLSGVSYPASKQDLLEEADEQGAGEEIRSLLAQLPDRLFETPSDVSEEIGQLEERRQ